MLVQFVNVIGAFITYVMIQALNVKQLESLFDTDLKGKLKTEIAHEWVNNAISQRCILSTFCQLPTVKRSLPLYSPIPINRPLPPLVQKRIIDIQGSRKKINPTDPMWTQYEMDKVSFSILVSTFKKKYPRLYAEFERLRKESIEEEEKIDSHWG